MIGLEKSKRQNIAHINLGSKLDSFSAGIMVANGCPRVSDNPYIFSCNYYQLEEILEEIEDYKFSPELKKDYKIWKRVQSAKWESLSAYLDKVDSGPCKLFKHQRFGIEWLRNKNSAIIADEMGLGKSRLAMTAAPKNIPILIVCPANVKGTWKKELKKWINKDSEILGGRKSFRFPENNEVLITNYDILPEGLYRKVSKKEDKAVQTKLKRDGKKERELILADCPEGLVIIVDEGHRIKSTKTLRGKRMRYLAVETHKKFGKVWVLTGTPINQSADDLYGILYNIDAIEESFGNRPNFIYQFGGRSTGTGIIWNTPRPTAVNFMQNIILRRKADDVLDLPPFTETDIYIETDDDVRAICEAFENAYNALGIDLEEALELAKDPGSPMYTHFMKLKSSLATAKIPAVEELLEDYDPAEPIIVACSHLKPIKYFGTWKGWRYIDGSVSSEEREKIVELFQAGKIKLALSTLAGGEGLTLHRGCYIIVMDSTLTPGPLAQVKKRIHRPGQKRSCHCTNMYFDHPLETRIGEILTRKTNVIMETVDKLVCKN